MALHIPNRPFENCSDSIFLLHQCLLLVSSVETQDLARVTDLLVASRTFIAAWQLYQKVSTLIELNLVSICIVFNIDSDIRKLGRDFPVVGNVDKLVEECCDLGVYANRVLGIRERWSMSRLVREFVSFSNLK